MVSVVYLKDAFSFRLRRVALTKCVLLHSRLKSFKKAEILCKMIESEFLLAEIYQHIVS